MQASEIVVHCHQNSYAHFYSCENIRHLLNIFDLLTSNVSYYEEMCHIHKIKNIVQIFLGVEVDNLSNVHVHFGVDLSQFSDIQ